MAYNVLFDGNARRLDIGKRTEAPKSPANQKYKLVNGEPRPPSARPISKLTKANQALQPQVTAADAFANPRLREAAYYADDNVLIFNMDVSDAVARLRQAGVTVNCIVTSPPFYGQRDYRVAGQIGLEDHPSEFIAKLVRYFEVCRSILTENGSLWVNLGDTYWSGKGEHKSGEVKQSARRFGLRPQDQKGDGKLCRPKQLLLIPHRFAISMQDQGWIVRNDNVWVKPNPIPDQVRDRCSMSHEYMFHLVKSRWYYFNKESSWRSWREGSPTNLARLPCY